MSFAEKVDPPEDAARTELRRTLFEMCYERVDRGELDPTSVPAEVSHLLGYYSGEHAPRTTGRIALSGTPGMHENQLERRTVVAVIEKTDT